MKRFTCESCGAEVFFDSTSCVRCHSSLGYCLEADDIVTLGEGRVRCANADTAGCTWVTTGPGQWCESCALTQTRPAAQDEVGMRLWPLAEQSKRHLLRDLTRLSFPVQSKADVSGGLRFDLLSSVDANVTIGHADGIITIDLAEGDHSHREKVRKQLAEPYRTMLGHFRHESGHYFEWLLVENTDRIEEARTLFGDERTSYADAIDRHYAHGAPKDWQERYISQYATMHPYEDFAEVWAHYLHIQDTLETAAAFHLIEAPAPDAPFRDVVVNTWLPLATAMNIVNRSLGHRDLYPFTMPTPVLEKLDFVDALRKAV